MKKRQDVVYLKDLLDAVERIESYMQSIDKSRFANDQMRQDAVIRQIEIIGEAAKQVSDESKRRYRNVPWTRMSGMRNALIHGYYNVDIPTVWDTVKNDLPEVKALVSQLLEQLEG